MEKVFEIYIRTTPERLWEAITDPEIAQQVPLRQPRRRPTGRPGSDYELTNPGAPSLGEGENLEVDPPRRLVQTMTALWGDEVKAAGTSHGSPGRSSRWATRAGSLSPTTSSAKAPTTSSTAAGPMILSGLKTWLETGELLTTPGSLMYT